MKRLLIALCVMLYVNGQKALTVSVDEHESVQFNHHMRPILSENCFTCHELDQAKRKSGLRLDKHRGATRDLGEWFRRRKKPTDGHWCDVWLDLLDNPTEEQLLATAFHSEYPDKR